MSSLSADSQGSRPLAEIAGDFSVFTYKAQAAITTLTDTVTKDVGKLSEPRSLSFVQVLGVIIDGFDQVARSTDGIMGKWNELLTEAHKIGDSGDKGPLMITREETTLPAVDTCRSLHEKLAEQLPRISRHMDDMRQDSLRDATSADPEQVKEWYGEMIDTLREMSQLLDDHNQAVAAYAGVELTQEQARGTGTDLGASL